MNSFKLDVILLFNLIKFLFVLCQLSYAKLHIQIDIEIHFHVSDTSLALIQITRFDLKKNCKCFTKNVY